MCVSLFPCDSAYFGVRSGICKYSVAVTPCYSTATEYGYMVVEKTQFKKGWRHENRGILWTLVMYRSSDTSPSLRLNDTFF